MAYDGESWADIDASIETVFAIVSDLELVPQWQPDVKVSECLERDAEGRAILIHTELETVIRRTVARVRVSFDEPSCVSWVMEDGDVPAFEGSWTLTDNGDGTTRAQYSVTIDFGRKLGMLVRGPAGKALKGAAVSSMPQKLKAFVEQHEVKPKAKRQSRGRRAAAA